MKMENITSKYLTKNQQASIQRLLEGFTKTLAAIQKDRMALLGIVIIGMFVLIAIIAPKLAPYGPEVSHVTQTGPETLEPPSWEHPFGTTHLAQDVFSQWIYGTRVSVLVGFLSGLVVMIIGTNVGLIAGYYKGRVDNFLMRIVDILYGIPSIPLILILAMFFGASITNIFLAMIFVLWRTMARVIRAQTLSISERPFVKAARASGASNLRIMYVHILPNLLPLVFIETIINVSSAIILEASVSFLGAGAENMVSWGTMLQNTFATGAIRIAWWWVLPPGISIAMIVLSLFYVSRAVEEVTNPEVNRY